MHIRVDPMVETFKICGRELTLPDPPKTPALYKEYPGSSRKMEQEEIVEVEMEAEEVPLAEEMTIETEIPEQAEKEPPKMKRIVKRKYTRKVKKQS